MFRFLDSLYWIIIWLYLPEDKVFGLYPKCNNALCSITLSEGLYSNVNRFNFLNPTIN